MSFRKRNVGVNSPGTPESPNASKQPVYPGVRPSPLDGRLTTSTGTHSLDLLLAGHGGLSMGTSILLEETGTTDFAGNLLRYYAAEGIVQGHFIHVLGVNDGWTKELPGLAQRSSGHQLPDETRSNLSGPMKIAWRYEKLGEIGAGRERTPSPNASTLDGSSQPYSGTFCHNFDLSKRLSLPSPSPVTCFPIQANHINSASKTEASSPFTSFINYMMKQFVNSPPSTIHRIIIPSILSPTLYPPDASTPHQVLQFFHALRALLRANHTRATALVSLPLSLYPRSTGLTRWMETMSDGVIELSLFPSHVSLPTLTAATLHHEDPPQGILRFHRLPVFHEKGGGVGQSGGHNDDRAFTLSKRKGLVIKPFSLPPLEDDQDTKHSSSEAVSNKPSRTGIEF